MSYQLTLLGTGAAMPSPSRFTSAQVLDAVQKAYLLDCGEGTQMRMQSFQVRMHAISQIFISHLHGSFFRLAGAAHVLGAYRPTKAGNHFFAPRAGRNSAHHLQACLCR